MTSLHIFLYQQLRANILKKLLIVEDDNDMLSLMGYLFDESEFEIEESQKPIPIPGIVRLNPSIVVIDCFLDNAQYCNDMCLEMKSNPITKDIPVILYSTSPELKTMAENCGAGAYINKPFVLYYFVKMVRVLAL